MLALLPEAIFPYIAVFPGTSARISLANLLELQTHRPEESLAAARRLLESHVEACPACNAVEKWCSARDCCTRSPFSRNCSVSSVCVSGRAWCWPEHLLKSCWLAMQHQDRLS